MSELLSVTEARQRILDAIRAVDSQTCDLAQALGRVLAEDIRAGNDFPPFSNSSMDGFAVQSADTAAASRAQPARLRVVEDIPAGSVPQARLSSGEAARIMTGAPLPEGADAIVPVEDTDADGAGLPQTVQIYRGQPSGSYIRRRGQDIASGQIILPRGRQITPQDMGMLATLGVARVPVYRKPRIGLISSGNELVDPTEALAPGKIRDANTYTLAGLIEANGGEALPPQRVRDDPEQVRTALDAAVSAQADLLVTSAGVSVGAFDYIRTVIEEQGQLDFWRVNMRPGKPVAFGSYQGRPVIGLPGNPVSAFVGFVVFVAPVLRRMAGQPDEQRRLRKAVLTHPLDSDGRESYLRAIVIEGEHGAQISLTGNQNSGNLFSLVQGNALLIVPSGVKSLPSGAVVDYWPILL